MQHCGGDQQVGSNPDGAVIGRHSTAASLQQLPVPGGKRGLADSIGCCAPFLLQEAWQLATGRTHLGPGSRAVGHSKQVASRVVLRPEIPLRAVHETALCGEDWKDCPPFASLCNLKLLLAHHSIAALYYMAMCSKQKQGQPACTI